MADRCSLAAAGLSSLKREALWSQGETPVEFWVDGQREGIFWCTPDSLEQLAAGHLVTQGRISCWEDIDLVQVEPAQGRIWVLRKNAAKKSFPLKDQYNLEQLADYRRNHSSRRTLSMKELTGLAEEMEGFRAKLTAAGGLHAAGLLGPGGEKLVRGDIGRHNAVDKVIGVGLQLGLDLSQCALATTGRVSADMLCKAAITGIPVLASMKYPSDTGVALAHGSEIAVVGFICQPHPVIYSASWRIKNEKQGLE